MHAHVQNFATSQSFACAQRSLIAPDYVLKVTELIYPQPVSRDRMAFLNFMKAHFLRQEEDGDRKFERLVELL